MADTEYSAPQRPAQLSAAVHHDLAQFTASRQAMLRSFRQCLENGLLFDDAAVEIDSTVSALHQILALARRP